jgi:hypothetical protein
LPYHPSELGEVWLFAWPEGLEKFAGATDKATGGLFAAVYAMAAGPGKRRPGWKLDRGLC